MVHANSSSVKELRAGVSRSAFLASLAAAAVGSRAVAAFAQSEPLRLGAAGSEAFDEAFFVVDGGFLTRAGLSGGAELLSNGPRIMEAVLGGSMDLGMSDTVQLANAVNHGLPLGFFAGGGLYDTNAPTTVLCVPKTSPLHDAKDLEGKTIGLQGLKTLAEISTREWLRQHGADPARVSFVEMAPSAIVPTMLRGTIAAAMVSEPFVSAAGSDIRIFAKPYDTVAKRFYISSWYGKRDWLMAPGGNGRKVQQAIYAAAAWANAHQDESGAILVKRLKLDPDRVKTMTRATFATSLDPKLMQPVLDIALKYNLLEHAVDAATLIALK
jgi:NitT/TauT family transport system substrate-binding protein